MLLLVPLLAAAAAADSSACLATKWWHCPEAGHTGHCASGQKAFRYACPPDVDFDSCTDHNKCPAPPEHGDCASLYASGLCRPWWTAWSDWSTCLTSADSCGHQQRSQRRNCAGLASHGNPASERGSCRDRRVIFKMRRRGEAITVRATTCPVRLNCRGKINGGWTEWSSLSECSVNCGLGYQEQKRTCENPIPSGGGVPCSGFDTKRVPCLRDKPCPMHGGWCAWSHIEQCDASCGQGVGIRLRLCRCPPPMHGGSACSGPNTELAECYMANCPYSEQLFEDERVLLRDSLRATSQEQAFQYMGESPPVTEGELRLNCGPESPLRKQLFDRPGRFPERRYFWTKDGNLLNVTERVHFNTEDLHILNVMTSDAGLYQLMVERAPGRTPNTVCFVPVPVLDTTIRLPEDNHFNLSCPLAALKNVTPTMMGAWKIYWSFNPSPMGLHFGGKPQREIWMTDSLRQSLDVAGIVHVTSMAAFMEGTYECRIQLMFVRDLNATDPDADPPPPPDDADEEGAYASLSSSEPRNLSISDTELSELFLVARVTVEMVPNPNIREFLASFLSNNYHVILVMLICAALIGIGSCVGDLLQALRAWRRRVWMQHLDAEEMNLLKKRVKEVQTGWTRQNDREVKKKLI